MAAFPTFPGKNPNETIKAFVRPHWLVLLRPMAAFLFLAILPIGVIAALSANGAEISTGIGLAIAAVTVPAYYLTLVTWFFIAWIDYYLDVGIVTDQRVIDIDQRGLFRRNVAELECRMVQDINADKTGILQTLFNFGDVIVQTAGERPNFRFHAIPNPDAMVDEIRRVMNVGSGPEGDAAGKMEEAASKMKAAAEKISEEKPAAPVQPSSQPTPQAPHQPQPQQSQQAPNELPREYER